MKLNDFIRQQQEQDSLKNTSKSELMRYLIDGFQAGQQIAAKATYEAVCRDIAKQISTGSKRACGMVGVHDGFSLKELPKDFSIRGTDAIRKAILSEQGISWFYSDMDGGDWSVPCSQIIRTSTGYISTRVGKRAISNAEKVVKTCAWDGYEKEVRQLFSTEGISFEFKVAVITRKPHKEDEIKTIIDFDQEYDYRLHNWFGSGSIRLKVMIKYTYMHR